MANIVNLFKPILLTFLESNQVKLLVLALLEAYARSTSNSVDDTVVAVVRARLFPTR